MPRPRSEGPKPKPGILAPLGAISTIQFDAPGDAGDDLDAFLGRVDSLKRTRPALMRDCVRAIQTTAGTLADVNWQQQSVAGLAAVVEGFFCASRAATAIFPSSRIAARDRRRLYVAWWLVRNYDDGVRPEAMLTLFTIVFDGARPALTEVARRCLHVVNAGSLMAGMLPSFPPDEDPTPVIDTLSRLALKGVVVRDGRRVRVVHRVPEQLREASAREEFSNALAVEVLEYLRDLSPIEALIRGLDGEFWKLPGIAANRLPRYRGHRQRGAPGDEEASRTFADIEIDALPECDAGLPQGAILGAPLNAASVAQSPDELAEAADLFARLSEYGVLLASGATQEEIAAEKSVSTKTVARHVARDRETVRSHVNPPF
jgi:hypothetical protein